ncbi:unnamed protein product [Polarella glacialis]|uniref:Uncharacterized protein n=1 Tax=Polarella glacialis TaxID=89957 RepID=A0A813GUN1_POLGL|nr:unnamed protein product [Polarella glacialis]
MGQSVSSGRTTVKFCLGYELQWQERLKNELEARGYSAEEARELGVRIFDRDGRALDAILVGPLLPGLECFPLQVELPGLRPQRRLQLKLEFVVEGLAGEPLADDRSSSDDRTFFSETSSSNLFAAVNPTSLLFFH